MKIHSSTWFLFTMSQYRILNMQTTRKSLIQCERAGCLTVRVKSPLFDFAFRKICCQNRADKQMLCSIAIHWQEQARTTASTVQPSKKLTAYGLTVTPRRWHGAHPALHRYASRWDVTHQKVRRKPAPWIHPDHQKQDCFRHPDHPHPPSDCSSCCKEDAIKRRLSDNQRRQTLRL